LTVTVGGQGTISPVKGRRSTVAFRVEGNTTTLLPPSFWIDNRSRRLPALLALLGALAALPAGCGGGAGTTPGNTRLTVTRDFGAKLQHEVEAPKVAGSETVLRLLQRNARVTTRSGGGFVQSIDGIAGGRRAGRPVDWFLFVNGVEAPEGAGSVRVHPGDRIWLDRHDAGAAMRVPAVVGSFPEPFLHGTGGRRLPVRVECVDPAAAACDAVYTALTDLDVPAAKGGLGTAQVEDSLRVVVGPWIAAREDHALRRLEAGPARSGVYARPSADGRSIATLDPRGRTARTLGPGSGLVAATRADDAPPVWAVTGTDAAGVTAAAKAFTARALGRRFAVAVAGGQPVALPEDGAA
jgi:Domain of unknown function (DUF4430)